MEICCGVSLLLPIFYKYEYGQICPESDFCVLATENVHLERKTKWRKIEHIRRYIEINKCSSVREKIGIKYRITFRAHAFLDRMIDENEMRKTRMKISIASHHL